MTDSVVELQCGYSMQSEASDSGSTQSTCDAQEVGSGFDTDDEEWCPSPQPSLISSPAVSLQVSPRLQVEDLSQLPFIAQPPLHESWQNSTQQGNPFQFAAAQVSAPQPTMMFMVPVMMQCFDPPCQSAETYRCNMPNTNAKTEQRGDQQCANATEALQTTLIIRNLPEECQLSTMLKTLDEHGFSCAYDFVHVPVDFATKSSLRYALVNFIDHAVAKWFAQDFNGFQDISMSWSTELQGLKAHVQRYRNSPVMHANVPYEYQPALFSKGQRVAFPSPTVRIKAPRVRHPKSGARMVKEAEC